MSLADTTAFSATPPATSTASKISPATWVWLFVALVAVLWGISVALFGIPGLYMPAVALVPVIFAALIVISRG